MQRASGVERAARKPVVGDEDAISFAHREQARRLGKLETRAHDQAGDAALYDVKPAPILAARHEDGDDVRARRVSHDVVRGVGLAVECNETDPLRGALHVEGSKDVRARALLLERDPKARRLGSELEQPRSRLAIRHGQTEESDTLVGERVRGDAPTLREEWQGVQLEEMRIDRPHDTRLPARERKRSRKTCLAQVGDLTQFELLHGGVRSRSASGS